jgi:lipopolysaccharide transport system permease protein
MINTEVQKGAWERCSLAKFLNPFHIIRHLWRHGNLIKQLTRREIFMRYKGSFLGFAWAFIHPLMMLTVYTFIFSVIFQAKWGVTSDEGRLGFALALFTGILTFNIVGEVANASPHLIIHHPNYVKKVIFPLEILPVVHLLSTLAHALLGMGILTLGFAFTSYRLNGTLLMLPLVWLPVIFTSLGLGYFLSSLGVFIRDLGPSVGVLVNMLLFLSPIFFPISSVPESLKIYCQMNPIAIFVEDARRVVLWGQYPDWPWFFAGAGFSLILFVLGFIWFMRSKSAFADVM